MVGSAIYRKLQQEVFENIITRSSSELEFGNQAAVEEVFELEKSDYVFFAAAKVGGNSGK